MTRKRTRPKYSGISYGPDKKAIKRDMAPALPANPSVADIRAMLQAERKQRAEACLKEIQAAIQPILNRYNCESRIASEWVIFPLDPK